MDDVATRIGGQARTLDDLGALTTLVLLLASTGETTVQVEPAVLRARMGRMYLYYLLNGLDFEMSFSVSRVGMRNPGLDYLDANELEACKRDHDAAAARLQRVLPELGWAEPVRKALLHAAIGNVVELWRKKASVLKRVADASLLLTVRIAAQATHTDTVLLYGETGTGKESAAKAIHQLGTRATQPFKVINCGAITESLAEAALNGIAKGVASGVAASPGFLAEADGGTLFLDEIDKAPLSLQGALLRVMGSKVRRPVGTTTEEPVDVRFIAATNRDLPTAVASGAFLEDLYFRLNPDFKLTLPPLRERTLADFSALWFELVRPGSAEELTAEDVYMQSVAVEQAVTLFSQREWPGNIRQLESFARFFKRSTRNRNPVVWIPEILALLPDASPPKWPPPYVVAAASRAVGVASFNDVMADLDTAVIEQVITEEGGLEPAAKRLGLSYDALKKRRQRSKG
jgi:transcriptional regulator with PAS, ATPase and Fis domain